MDPLNEYLAGLRLVDEGSQDKHFWHSFLNEADKKEGALNSIRGFLLAVSDCCNALPAVNGELTFLKEELAICLAGGAMPSEDTYGPSHGTPRSP